jgi:hypothetical protein
MISLGVAVWFIDYAVIGAALFSYAIALACSTNKED